MSPEELVREALEKQIIELNQQLAEAEAQALAGARAVVALREACEDVVKVINALLNGQAPLATTFHYGERVNRALADTEPIAREHDARVTRAALERAAKLVGDGGLASKHIADAIRALATEVKP